MTEQIQYTLLRKFGEDLIREIQISDDPNEWDYSQYIMGYALGLIQALKPDKKRVQYVHKYNRAPEYCKNRLKKTDGVNKVLSSASSDEIISLYETGWSSRDTCDFYDEYEELEKKYLKEAVI